MSGADSAIESTSEDVCVIPEAVRRLVIPRRGGAGAEPIVVDPGAAASHAEWLAKQSSLIAQILDDEHSEPLLVQEYRDGRAAPDGSSPLAAAVEAAIAISHDTPNYKNPAGVVDAWIATRSLPFAVSAAVELFSVIGVGEYYAGQRSAPRLRRREGRQEELAEASTRLALAARLRAHLAVAGEQDYSQAQAILAAHRAKTTRPTTAETWSRMLTSFLLPERADWVEADFALVTRSWDALLAWLAVSSITTADQVAAFPVQNVYATHIVREPAVFWTALAAVGADLLPGLIRWIDGDSATETTHSVLAVVACVASPEAMLYLVDNLGKKHYTAALQTAAKHFPRRALHILADAALRDTPRGTAAANLLRMHILAEERTVKAELPNLTPAALDLVEKIRAASVRIAEADADSLPPLFVSPPWLTGARPSEPVVVTGLSAPTEAAMAWRDGEKDQWASPVIDENPRWTLPSWQEIAGLITEEGTARWYADGHFAVAAPEDLVRSVMADWQPNSWQAGKWVRRLTVRFGADALPPVLHLARREPATCAALLAPFAAPEAALLAADWLSRLKSARPFALAWLTRHPGVAARTLIPVALGKPGKARAAAELTLRALAAHGFAGEVADAAAGYGDTAARAVAALIADDGTLTLPKKMPVVPDWADPRTLPQILLKGRQAALPEQAVRHLLLMLAISTPAEPYAGVPMAKDFCDPESLADFAWALFQSWSGVDYPAAQSWALDALRWFGDDAAVRRLSPLIRQWPADGGHLRAVAGLDVLAQIGGDLALMHLYDISQKAKFMGLKEQATRRVTDIAGDLGLTAGQLGDRLVPDLGLDPSGTLVLDYGPRRFTVGFDEQLKPYVVDSAGKRLKTLPKPGAKDDPELAPAAYQRFSAVKKDARALAASQISRFELAMVTQRRWTSREFAEYFVGHPLLRHIVRRLVWAAYTDDGAAGTFRVAEDLTLADVADDAYRLADDALIGIAHPLDLGADAAAWSEVFADYEILQPFAQLGREAYALTDTERTARELTRFEGRQTPVGKVLGLERRGWRRGAPEDAGIQNWISRPLPGGGSITVALHPGIVAGYVTEYGQTQRFEAVFISTYDDGEGYQRRKQYAEFGSLDAVTASEMLRDLTDAMG